MYGKIHQSIYDSSIAEDPEVRWIFQDMVILSDKNGYLDITPRAFARRINVPVEQVEKVIAKLLQPDPNSKSSAEDGRRIKPIDPNRSWGWIVINKAQYRDKLGLYEKREKEALRQKRKYHRDKLTAELKAQGKTPEEIAKAISLLELSFQETSRQTHAPHTTSPHTYTDTDSYKRLCEICSKEFTALEKWFSKCPACFKNSKGHPSAQPPVSKYPQCKYCGASQNYLNVDDKLKGCNVCKPEEIE